MQERKEREGKETHLGVTERTDTSWDDRHLQQRVGMLEEPPANRMARLMVGDRPLLLLAQHARLPLEPNDDPLDGRLKVLLLDGLSVPSRAVERSLVADVGNVRPGEPRRKHSELLSNVVRF